MNTIATITPPAFGPGPGCVASWTMSHMANAMPVIGRSEQKTAIVTRADPMWISCAALES
jgi:hypothetical protein